MTEAAGDGFVEYLLEQRRDEDMTKVPPDDLQELSGAVFDRDPSYLVGQEHVNPCAEIHLPDIRPGGPRISPTGRAMADVPQVHGTTSMPGGTHQYFNSFQDWREYMGTGGRRVRSFNFRDWREYTINGERGMRQDAWEGFKLAFFQPFKLAWYATRDTVARNIFIWTKGKVNLGARIYDNSAVDLSKSEAPKVYPHAMAHRTGTRALDIRYDRPWWRRFIARDFG